MKKFIAITRIVFILGMGTILTTMVVQGIIQSIDENGEKDIVLDAKDVKENDNQITVEKMNGELANQLEPNEIMDNADTTLSNVNKDSKQIIATEKEVNTPNYSELNTGSDSQTDTSKSSDFESNLLEKDNLESDMVESDSINSANLEKESLNISSLDHGSADRNGMMNENQQNNIEGDDQEDNIQDMQTALNITNPSIKLEASSAILLDSKTGKVLYHKNATTAVYPASTTKLMTALVALDLCDISEKITIGKEVYLIASDSSRAYLASGQRLTLQMLLEGLLVPSGNDAAYAIATYVGRVSLQDQKVDEKIAIQEFVRLMNVKVAELGLGNTQFKNPDGYDEEGQYTSAYDMGMIAIEALNKEIIRTISNKTNARNVFLSGEDVTWHSSNKLITSGSGKYYIYAIGLKTGTSSLAGRCLVSAAQKEDNVYISVVMNSSSLGRWDDSIALLEYGIEE